MPALLILKRKGYMIKQEKNLEICNHPVDVVVDSVIVSSSKRLILMKYLECSSGEVYLKAKVEEDKHSGTRNTTQVGPIDSNKTMKMIHL